MVRETKKLSNSKSVPGGIRTPNLLIRSQKLYPVELQALRNLRFSISNFRFAEWKSTIANPKSIWGGRRDSNPQQPEPQSGALPLSYDHHSLVRNRILKFQRFFANKGLDMPAAIH